MRKLVQMPFFNNLNGLVYFEHVVSLFCEESDDSLVSGQEKN